MLGDSDVQATIAVKDINKGKQFYGQTLGLKQLSENPGGVQYASGNGRVFVYQSDTAGSGQASCASWAVDDLEATVEVLKAKGVKFEHYPDMPGVTLESDVHVMGPMKAAWFKDPDGNILHVGLKM
jgi:catechol 2,3-dioxygenase-like lactoylglutathione lyase family enzyme